jgi:hypothetical protein
VTFQLVVPSWVSPFQGFLAGMEEISLFFCSKAAEKKHNMALLSDILALGPKNAQER